MNTLIRLWNDDTGSAAIEYGLLAALISIAAIGGMTALGGSLSAEFTSIKSHLAR